VSEPGSQRIETAESSEAIRALVENLGRVVHAPDETLLLCVLCLVSEGHLILEDFPGVGKTMLAKALARSLDVSFSRMQFTPDLLPSDVTGVNVFNQRSNEFEFRPGPVFANLLLVDEINRASPKTQAALLECMQEQQVTIDGVTNELARPFMVMATQNPIEYEGTYPLPEAQLDRFVARVRLGYLDEAGEAEMARRRLERGSAPPRPAEILDAGALIAMRESLEQVHLDDDLLGYVVRLVAATRSHPQITVGASPRGTLAVIQLARGHAALDSRDYVIPEDVKAVAVPALAHRLVLRPEMWVRKVTGEDLISEILTAQPVPRASQ
jgi:MoxR-like ATPase